ncbi:hypothetical protein ABPG72_019830 [Tetrahymena utriculariae]
MFLQKSPKFNPPKFYYDGARILDALTLFYFNEINGGNDGQQKGKSDFSGVQYVLHKDLKDVENISILKEELGTDFIEKVSTIFPLEKLLQNIQQDNLYFSIKYIILIVETTVVSFAIAYDNCEGSRRLFYEKYEKEAPPASTIRDWRNRFLETLSLEPRKRIGDHSRQMIPEEKKQEVIQNFIQNPMTSQRKVAKLTQISQKSVGNILKQENLYPWKLRLVQEITESDTFKRLEFCEKILGIQEMESKFIQNIVFSDEASFGLDGSVNLHNAYYYSYNNPHQTISKSMKSPAITYWAMLSYNDGLVNYVYCENTVNTAIYCDILNETVVPYFKKKGNEQLFFQQDGAPPHFSNDARNILNTQLQYRWIGRGGPIEWPPRSPDLSINDFWLWGYVRQLLYEHPKPTNQEELINKVNTILDDIKTEMVRCAYENFYKRLTTCIEQDGDQFQQYI